MPLVSTKTRVTAIAGDGIGPEVMRAVQAHPGSRRCADRMGGGERRRRGIPQGHRHRLPAGTRWTASPAPAIALKGPLETPVGYGEKSANVTLRKFFELYGNIRPVRELPGIHPPFSGRGIDLVIVRENVEDLYAGIEYMQTPGVAECLKLITDPGCERILRLAYGLARAEGRSKLACATKANIMKATEGMMKRVYERIAPEYQDIAGSHIIIDNCAHQLVINPEQFDVIVTTNMNGDIISDLAAGPGRRAGRRAEFEYRRPGSHVRGGARLGAADRGQEPRQPDGAAAVRGDDAAPHPGLRRRRAR